MLYAGKQTVFGPKQGGGGSDSAAAISLNPEDVTPRATSQTQKDRYQMTDPKWSDSQRQRRKPWGPRWGEGLGEFKWAESGRMKTFWGQTESGRLKTFWGRTAVMIAGQWECTHCH